jgi:hypothetical protein
MLKRDTLSKVDRVFSSLPSPPFTNEEKQMAAKQVS